MENNFFKSLNEWSDVCNERINANLLKISVNE
jgi:hypothetical protein